MTFLSQNCDFGKEDDYVIKQKLEIKCHNTLISNLLFWSREWVLNHIFKNIHRNSKDIKYHVNQCFVNLGHSHKFLKNPLFCCFWLPFGYLNQNFLLPL